MNIFAKFIVLMFISLFLLVLVSDWQTWIDYVIKPKKKKENDKLLNK